MTLTEAIAHCQEIAGQQSCACGAKHRQLAEWLGELQLARETIARLQTEAEQASERFQRVQLAATQWRERAEHAEGHRNQLLELLPAQ